MKSFRKNVLRLALRNKGAIIGAMLIIGIGIFVYVSMIDTLRNLDDQVQAYYRESELADVFAEVEGISSPELERLTEIPGIKSAGGHMARDVRILADGQETIVTVHLLSYDPEDEINRITLLKAADTGFRGDGIIHAAADWTASAGDDAEAGQAGTAPTGMESSRGAAFGEGNAAEVMTSGTKLQPGETPEEDDIFLGVRMEGYYVYPAGTEIKLLAGGQALRFNYRGICRSPDYIYSIPHGGAMAPDGEVYDIAAISKDRMERLLGVSDSLNELGFVLADGYSYEDVRHQLTDRLTQYGLKSICERADQASVDMVEGEMLELISTGTILPVIFMAISVFMLYVVLKKMIDKDRTLIGTMKAFGMTNRELIGAYLIEGVLIGVGGALIGSVAAGPFGRSMFALYIDFFTLPDPLYHDFLQSRVTGLLISLGTAVLAVFLGVRDILGITPAMAMRQPEPKAGRNLRLPGALEKHLRVQTRIGLRSMGRNPLRGFLIVLAVMFAFSLSSALFSFKPLYDELLKGQFEDIQVYDIQLTLDRFVTPQQANDAGTVLDGAKETEAVCQTAVALRHGNLTSYTLLYGLNPDSRLYRIRDNDGVFYRPPADGIIINRRTAEDLHVRAGDYVELMGTGLTEGFVRVRVTDVISELIGENCYVSLDSFPSLFHSDPMANTMLLKTAPEQMDTLRRRLMDTSRVSWIVDTAKIVDAYRSMFGSMLYMVDMFALLSVAAGAILIYNISMISLKERYTEIGTLEVLGMTHRELGSMLLTEKIVYFVLGSLLGLPGSYAINRLLEALIISDSFDLKLHVTPRICAVTALICFLMVMSAWYAEQRLIQRIELTETLKARE